MAWAPSLRLLSTAARNSSQRRRVGIVGFGAVGKYLANAILKDPACQETLELAFVCEPVDPGAVVASGTVPKEAALDDLADFASKDADLIVEVAHASISERYGAAFLQNADYMPASTTAFADAKLEAQLVAVARDTSTTHGLYLPSGALWGARDIQKMDERGALRALTVTMKKAPHHLKLYGEVGECLEALLADGVQGEHVLYEGPVRNLAAFAPNNVNTMAAAALAAPSIGGFDGVTARLVMDTDTEAHVVTVDVEGPVSKPGAPPFKLSTVRYNPAAAGAVTGDATYSSFMSSMLEARDRGAGVHFC